MSHTALTPEEHFAKLVEAFLEHPDITPPARWKGFGASGLKVHHKLFALLSSEGRFVVKLSKQRVEALIVSGDGERFDPGHTGRSMKEWLSLKPTSEQDWLALAREALEFVATQR